MAFKLLSGQRSRPFAECGSAVVAQALISARILAFRTAKRGGASALIFLLALLPLSGPSRAEHLGLVPAAAPQDRYLFGTLDTVPKGAPLAYQAGIRLAQLELAWDRYEPRDGVFSAAYAEQAGQQLEEYRAAGLQVVLGVGLQYGPAWLLDSPNSRYVNQYGRVVGPANLTFNLHLRQKAERYIARIDQDLGLKNFWAIRIGSGALIETLYPPGWDGEQGNSYWAYDAGAQKGTGLPPSIRPSPFPGWQPGQRTYRGKPFSTDQVEDWFGWYLGAMIDGVDWQISTYRRLGYEGYLQVLMAGRGTLPPHYAEAIGSYLDGSGDPDGTMSRGAVWHKVIDALAKRRNVVAYITSVADGSGGNDVCQPSDATVAPDSPAVTSWSAARWISYNADRQGLPKMGENPGRADVERYDRGLLRAAMAQMQACGFLGLMWAHDADLRDTKGGITLVDYAAAIAVATATR